MIYRKLKRKELKKWTEVSLGDIESVLVDIVGPLFIVWGL